MWAPSHASQSGAVVSKVADIPEAVRDVGCPGVLKPSTGVASLFTVRFDSEDELDRWFAQFDAAASGHHSAAIREMDGRWLVEEYLDGPGFSVESLTLGGETTHVAVCRKGEMSQPFFLETGHTGPAPIAPDLREKMEDVAGLAIQALGITPTPTHSPPPRRPAPTAPSGCASRPRSPQRVASATVRAAP